MQRVGGSCWTEVFLFSSVNKVGIFLASFARVELTAAMPEGCRALLGGEAGEERTDEE